jgi:hypothetical protein
LHPWRTSSIKSFENLSGAALRVFQPLHLPP